VAVSRSFPFQITFQEHQEPTKTSVRLYLAGYTIRCTNSLLTSMQLIMPARRLNQKNQKLSANASDKKPAWVVRRWLSLLFALVTQHLAFIGSCAASTNESVRHTETEKIVPKTQSANHRRHRKVPGTRV
jgi:hypothetical protein